MINILEQNNRNAKYSLTEIPRRINSTHIFTSKGDEFDNLGLILASLLPSCIGVCDGEGTQHHHKLITVP